MSTDVSLPGWWLAMPEDVRQVLPGVVADDAQGSRVLGKRLRQLLPEHQWAGLEDQECVSTWFTAWYNLRRLMQFQESRGFVEAIRFDAIMDSLVSDQCEARNGLLVAMSDPLLLTTVPPLHHACRSVLSPISGHRLEREGGAERLAADRARLLAAPPPGPGYGTVADPLATLEWMDGLTSPFAAP